MSLANASILSGATWAPTGGTALNFTPDGRSKENGIGLVVTADTNLVTRRTLQAKSVLPSLPANNGAFARLGRNAMTYSIPFVAADGKLYNQTIKIEAAFHAEYTQKSTRRNEAISFLADSDFTDFWDNSLLG